MPVTAQQQKRKWNKQAISQAWQRKSKSLWHMMKQKSATICLKLFQACKSLILEPFTSELADRLWGQALRMLCAEGHGRVWLWRHWHEDKEKNIYIVSKAYSGNVTLSYRTRAVLTLLKCNNRNFCMSWPNDLSLFFCNRAPGMCPPWILFPISLK